MHQPNGSGMYGRHGDSARLGAYRRGKIDAYLFKTDNDCYRTLR